MKATLFKWKGSRPWVVGNLVEKRPATTADLRELGRLGLSLSENSRSGSEVDLVAHGPDCCYVLWVQ